jgi:hypothetical protein
MVQVLEKPKPELGDLHTALHGKMLNYANDIHAYRPT